MVFFAPRKAWPAVGESCVRLWWSAAALLIAGTGLISQPLAASAAEEGQRLEGGSDLSGGSAATAPAAPREPGSTDLASGGSQATVKSPQAAAEARIYNIVTRPGWFVGVEEDVDWTFPGTGSAWGVGPANGSTKLDFGVSGNIRSSRHSSDTLLSWSVTLTPTFQHTYSDPGNDRTPLRLTLWTSISPLKGNALSFYGSWRGSFGNDEPGQRRVQSRIRGGVIYSFAGSRIIPDAIEKIDLPERGFYGRIEPTWYYRIDGQLNTVETQVFLGWSDTYYPFTFAIEAGPQFLQPSGAELQTILGSFFELGYVINTRTRAYLQYRPAISFGGSQVPAATQSFTAGLSVRF